MKTLVCGYNGSGMFLHQLLTQRYAFPSCIDSPVAPSWNECYASLRSADLDSFQITTTWQSACITHKGHTMSVGNLPALSNVGSESIMQVILVGSSTVVCLQDCEEFRRMHMITDYGSSVSCNFPMKKQISRIGLSLVDARKTPIILYGFRSGLKLWKLSLEKVSDGKGEAQIMKEYDIKTSDLVAGREHYMLLTSDGQVFSWGLSSRGQLGHGSLDADEEPQTIEAFEDMRITMIAAGGWSSVALNEHGLVFVWGWNSAGALGFPNRGVREQDKEVPASGDKQEVELLAEPRLLPLPEKVSWISCGERHAAAVSVTGKVYVWGLNQHGQLGVGDRQNRDHPVRMSTIGDARIERVFCGEWTTVLLQDEPSELPGKDSTYNKETIL